MSMELQAEAKDIFPVFQPLRGGVPMSLELSNCIMKEKECLFSSYVRVGSAVISGVHLPVCAYFSMCVKYRLRILTLFLPLFLG